MKQELSIKDKQIVELQKIIQLKKDEISKIESPNWETNCVFKHENISLNLHVISEKDLIWLAGFILSHKEFHDKANTALGTTLEFKHQGYTCEQWISDIKKRVNKLQVSSKKKDLDVLETRLEKLLSPELREQKELDEITNILNTMK
jgi:hypothetical protein